VRTRQGEKRYDCAEAGAFCTVPLYALQDDRTASAAEVFIGALTRNGRAVSLGARTFGKGRTQKVLSLMDGSGLILTDGELILPDGESYDGVGLEPGVALAGKDVELRVFIEEIERRECPPD
jgi:carboxyl-terminal processing protease